MPHEQPHYNPYPQLDQLIDTLQPSAEKPEPLSSTWPVLHERAMETMALVNKHGPIQAYSPEESFDLVPAVLFVLVAFIACLLAHQATGKRIAR